MLPKSVFAKTDPAAIAADRKAIQEMVNEAYCVYEALIVARIVAKDISSADEAREMACILFLAWERQIRDSIIGTAQSKVHYVDMAPKLCPEAPPYRPFEGIMSLVD